VPETQYNGNGFGAHRDVKQGEVR